ncbi:DUF134 domain-containing protein [Chloroflexota bacterium]
MPRPVRCRRVDSIPKVVYFKPAGIPMRMLEEVCLSVEEAEAIRLKDIERLEQEQCAEKMHISRPTFQRVLGSARQKIADALLNGKAIRIEGGNYEMATRRFRCLVGHEWEIPSEVMTDGTPEICPTCNTTSISAVQPTGLGEKGPGRHRRGRCEKK